jgi:hypothetical protein
MEGRAPQQYAIEFLGEDGDWVQWYATPDKNEAEKVWRRLLESGPRARVRLIELEVLRSTAGDAAEPERE